MNNNESLNFLRFVCFYIDQPLDNLGIGLLRRILQIIEKINVNHFELNKK